jgi:phosphohistidine phosphatase
MLILVRHAEAQPNSATGDHGRVLSENGRQQLGGLRHWLSDISVARGTDVRLLVSDAARTQETAAPLAEALDTVRQTETRIYEASLASLLALVEEQDDDRLLILVGHNPGLSQLASTLSGHNLALPVAGAVALDQNHRLISAHRLA